jgi:cobalamin biosynthesis protein CobD/CbiB
METMRDLLDGLISIGGLATGAVLSLVSGVLLLLSDIVKLDHTTLALAWIMMAFVFAIGFMTARRHMTEYQERLEREALSS